MPTRTPTNGILRVCARARAYVRVHVRVFVCACVSVYSHPPLLSLRSMAAQMRYSVEVQGVAGMPRLNPGVRALVPHLGSSACDFTGKCLHAFMYVCMSVCVYVRTYVCTYVCTYLCMYVCMQACMHVGVYMCVYVCM